MHNGTPTTWPTAALLLLPLLLTGAAGGNAHHPANPGGRLHAAQAHDGDRPTREMKISPRLGPPGTEVTVTAVGMPTITPVQLALGATRTGFEALALVLTSIDGEMEETVQVPSWVQRDQTHRFITFNLYFSRILAESMIFHVTDADGRVVRTGVVGVAGSDCLALEGDDGERYRLTGATGELEAGSRARLEGTLTEAPAGCGEELTLELRLDPGR